MSREIEKTAVVPVTASAEMMDAGVEAAQRAPLDSAGLPGYRVCRAAWDAMVACACASECVATPQDSVAVLQYAESISNALNLAWQDALKAARAVEALQSQQDGARGKCSAKHHTRPAIAPQGEALELGEPDRVPEWARREAARIAPQGGEDLILQAIARGWCAPENQHKIMDPDLALAINREVHAALATPQATPAAVDDTARLGTRERQLDALEQIANDVWDGKLEVPAAMTRVSAIIGAAAPVGAVPQGDTQAVAYYRQVADSAMRQCSELLDRAQTAEAALASQAARMGELSAKWRERAAQQHKTATRKIDPESREWGLGRSEGTDQCADELDAELAKLDAKP